MPYHGHAGCKRERTRPLAVAPSTPRSAPPLQNTSGYLNSAARRIWNSPRHPGLGSVLNPLSAALWVIPPAQCRLMGNPVQVYGFVDDGTSKT